MKNGVRSDIDPKEPRTSALLASPRMKAPVMVFVMLAPLLLLLPVLALSAVVVVNVIIARDGDGHSVSGPAEAPSAYVAIVLGARVYADGQPSPMLTDRLETALELYRDGKVKKVLVSGDHGQTHYDETNTMRNYLVDRGVPVQDIFMDHAGFDTHDTMYRARDVFLVKDALIVTQGFHLARAVYTARRLGLDVTGVPADRRPYADEFRFKARDWVARVKAFFDLNVFHPGPKFLGPEIPITGDGRATEG